MRASTSSGGSMCITCSTWDFNTNHHYCHQSQHCKCGHHHRHHNDENLNHLLSRRKCRHRRRGNCCCCHPADGFFVFVCICLYFFTISVTLRVVSLYLFCVFYLESSLSDCILLISVATIMKVKSHFLILVVKLNDYQDVCLRPHGHRGMRQGWRQCATWVEAWWRDSSQWW